MEKKALDKILRSTTTKGALKVTYWDGSVETYGHDNPSVHVIIKDKKAVWASMRKLSLGFGESYMNGLIDIEGPIIEINRLLTENKPKSVFVRRIPIIKAKNKNTKTNQKKLIDQHYSIGNDFYKLWLDKSLMYSCAYYKSPKDSLEKAQSQKIDHLLKKLLLKKDMKVLDIGSGWGSLLIRAAKDYGIQGLGITLSQNQQELSTKAAKAAGVDDKVQFKLLNYQDLADSGEMFDRIISVGMYEHVGVGNHRKYFRAVDTMLKPKGISVLHTITHNFETPTDVWIDKYIFPGGYIPSIRRTVAIMPDFDFELLDYENLRMHYAMTLKEWLKRYEAHKNKVIGMYDERFYRMWRLYLASAEAAFRYGDIQLSQFVFSKGISDDVPLTRDYLYK